MDKHLTIFFSFTIIVLVIGAVQSTLFSLVPKELIVLLILSVGLFFLYPHLKGKPVFLLLVTLFFLLLLNEAFHPNKLLHLILLCLADLLFLKILSITRTLFELKEKKSFFAITILLFWLIGLVSFLITDTHTNVMVVQIKVILLCFILFMGSCFLLSVSFPKEEGNISFLFLLEPLALVYIPLPWGLILAFLLAFLSTADHIGPQKGKSKYPSKP